MDSDDKTLYCDNCGSLATFGNGDDGYYYCQICGLQSQDVMDTEIDHFSGLYNTFHSRAIKLETMSQPPKLVPSPPNLKENEKPYCFEDEISTPLDFGNKKDMIDPLLSLTNLRLRYVEGLQLMIQMQCEALVDKFGVHPSICGTTGVIWLRYVVESRVFGEQWAADVIGNSEMAFKDQISKEKVGSFSTPIGSAHKTRNRKVVPLFMWSKTLKSKIPLASTLAICFLACYLAREAILPTDILKWALEGKLPYMAAFLDIEKYLGNASSARPLTSRHLFRPDHSVGTYHLEVLASSIAELTRLHLPPVNFYLIANRYLRQLSLPIKKILPHANDIYEWSMPPDLWLSTRPYKLPTCVCVMSILIVAIRILYDINGSGEWEKSLSSCQKSNLAVEVIQASEKFVESCKGNKKIGDTEAHSYKIFSNTEPSIITGSKLETAELLCKLEKEYYKVTNSHEYSKDLKSYLDYCKNVVFAGVNMSYEEETVAQQLWDIFEEEEDTKLPPKTEAGHDGLNLKRPRDGGVAASIDDQKLRENQNENSKASKGGCGDMDIELKTVNEADEHLCSSIKNKGKCMKAGNEIQNPSGKCSELDRARALERLKSDMEENMFRYIPPRTASQNKHKYIHYRRKKESGMLNYVAHADYYILLRACARVAQVDLRVMHIAVLKLERRLSWIEKRIDYTLEKINW